MPPKPDKLMPALYGGIVIGILSGVPGLNLINCLCCAGIMLGGIVSVYLYKSAMPPDAGPLETAECMTLGVMAGVFGALIETMITVALLAAFGNFWAEYLVDAVTEANIPLPDEMWEVLYGAVDAESTPFSVMIDFFFSVLFSTLFGMIGALIGYSVYRRDSRTVPPPAGTGGQQL